VRFDLRKPCVQCPFRPGGVLLNGPRAQEIADAVTIGDVTFTCHKTISGEHLELDDGEERYNPGRGDQMCAGAIALIRKTGAANQMLQIAERLGLCDPNRLSPEAEGMIYESVEAMVEAHEQSSPAFTKRASYRET
jgi:hypothetical protein